ncbi:protein vem-1-like [Montipora capricornis]|uniref:protein vem-1-like n=1 Tax=Montipora foliosa TaxID=591990 RepID=UPI0035F16C0A
MNKWMTSPRGRVRFKAQGTEVHFGSFDILTWFVQTCLDGLFSFGSVLLSLQVMWRTMFPTSQKKAANGEIHLSTGSAQCGNDLRSFTVRELRQYNGVRQNNIYFAVNGKVFDATSTGGIQFLDGPFSCLSGRDASRAFATYSFDSRLTSDSEMDDLSDLNPLQMDCLFQWEMQYSEMYPCVGRLVNNHQPYTLQHECIRTIRASLKRMNYVDELPLPKILRNKILSCG